MSPTERIKFEGARGDRLAARLEKPEGEPRAFALFAHCFTCSKDLKAVGAITRTLAGRGIATLRFDFTGLGESEGDFADTNFSTNLEDLFAAADWLRREYEAPRLLIGHSLGGAAALAGGADIDEVQAIATIGAPASTEHLRARLARQTPEVEEKGEAEVELAGRKIRIRKQFLDDLKEQDVERVIGNLRRALIVFHSPTDNVVGIDQARKIFEAARHPKSFISLDGADHLLLERREDAEFVGTVLAAWATRYLN